MERELWRRVYRLIRTLSRSGPAGRTDGRKRHSDAAVALTFLWAALHDRPDSWACDERNWTGRRRPKPLPSQPTLSRRLRTAAVRGLLAAVEAAAGGGLRPGLLAALDGKPLPVGGWSRDPDARSGRGAGQMAKGYKLYAAWGDGPLPCAWDVRPMNESEPAVAAALLPGVPGEGYLVADAVYDSNPLHDAAAAAGRQLLAPRKRPGCGLGHRRHSPHRLRSIELLSRPFGQGLLRLRDQIERHFARLTNPAGGLGPLPNWVRRLHRVRRWVQAKLILHGLRLSPRPI